MTPLRAVLSALFFCLVSATSADGETAVLSLATGYPENVTLAVLSNRLKYCALHGYTCILDLEALQQQCGQTRSTWDNFDIPRNWFKVYALRACLFRFKRIVCLRISPDGAVPIFTNDILSLNKHKKANMLCYIRAYSNAHAFSRSISAFSSGEKSSGMSNIDRISVGVLPLIILATRKQAESRRTLKAT